MKVEDLKYVALEGELLEESMKLVAKLCRVVADYAHARGGQAPDAVVIGAACGFIATVAQVTHTNPEALIESIRRTIASGAEKVPS